MAAKLVECEKCGTQHARKATHCPKCGYPASGYRFVCRSCDAVLNTQAATMEYSSIIVRDGNSSYHTSSHDIACQFCGEPHPRRRRMLAFIIIVISLITVPFIVQICAHAFASYEAYKVTHGVYCYNCSGSGRVTSDHVFNGTFVAFFLMFPFLFIMLSLHERVRRFFERRDMIRLGLNP